MDRRLLPCIETSLLLDVASLAQRHLDVIFNVSC